MEQRKNNLSAKDLTRGEKAYIIRCRRKLTQEQMAVGLGVCIAEYRAMERDEEGTTAPYYGVGKLEPFEVCAALRRRQGINKEELALEIGVSPYWLGRMESGMASAATLAIFWGVPDELG